MRLLQIEPKMATMYRGTSLMKPPPPEDHHRPLGIFLLYGPRGVRFRMSEVPLYSLPRRPGNTRIPGP